MPVNEFEVPWLTQDGMSGKVFRQPAVYLHSLRAVAPFSPNGWPEAAFLLYKANSLLIFQSARLNCEKSSEAQRPPEYRNMPVASLRVLVFLSRFPLPEMAFCTWISQHACGIFASPWRFIFGGKHSGLPLPPVFGKATINTRKSCHPPTRTCPGP